MKKVLMVALVLLVSVAFVSAVFAQAKPGPAPEKAKPAEKPAAAPEKPAPAKEAEKPAAPEKAEKAEKPAKPKPKVSGFTGKVAQVDPAMNVLAVKSGKKDVTFDTSNVKLKGYKSVDQVKAGDTVAVKYTKDGAQITKIAGAKPAKAAKAAAKPAKEKPAKEKKEKPAKEKKEKPKEK